MPYNTTQYHTMKATDPLYFHREDYAHKLLHSLSDSLSGGITHAFTLFAPHRMGKTQFLLQDIAPLAEQQGFNVFYFSFINDTSEDIASDFQTALFQFSQSIAKSTGVKTFLSSLNKIDILGVGIERQQQAQSLPKTSHIIGEIAQHSAPTLLLLDEVQELARMSNISGLIRSLRITSHRPRHQPSQDKNHLHRQQYKRIACHVSRPQSPIFPLFPCPRCSLVRARLHRFSSQHLPRENQPKHR